MIVEVTKGNLLESEAQTFVNTVNTVGVMGKGIALAFKKRFPEMYKDYVHRCKAGEVRLGQPYLFRTLWEPWIINFPTKEHWRSASRLDAIVEGLDYLGKHVGNWGVESLAVPPLGCGHGQLEWTVVGPTLYEKLDQLAIPVWLYAPHDAPADQLDPRFLRRQVQPSPPRIDAAWFAVAEIVSRLHHEQYAWPVGHTRLQKISYFATAAGLDLPLNFEERPYGPFATGLKRYLAQLVNNGVLVESHQGNMIRVTPGTTLAHVRTNYEPQLADYESAVSMVVDLMMRLDPRQTEIAASVQFVSRALRDKLRRNPTEKEILGEVQRWKKRRKPPLRETEVAEAIRNLNSLGWLDASPSADLPMDEVTLSYA